MHHLDLHCQTVSNVFPDINVRQQESQYLLFNALLECIVMLELLLQQIRAR